MPKLGQRGAIHLIIILILLAGIVGIVYLVTAGPLKIFPKATVSDPLTPTTSYTLSPSKSQYAVGEEVVVRILVHSDLAAANLFNAKINYDPQVLQLGRVDVTSPFIQNWVEQYWGEAGKVSLVGGVPDPGFQSQVGDTAPMATLYFTALKPGNTTISFDDASQIFSNANNTNILVGKYPLDLSIADASVVPASTLSYTISDNGWSAIGIPARFSMSPAQFLGLTNGKCTEIQGFDPATAQAKAYFTDSNKAILNSLSQVTGGNGYLIKCTNAPVSFSISVGEYITSMPNLVVSNVQYIAVPKGYNKTAEEFLNEVSNSSRDCTTVDRWVAGGWEGHIKGLPVNNFQMNDLSGYNVKCVLPATPSPTPVASAVPGTGDGNGDGKVNLTDLSILFSDFGKNRGFRRGIDMDGNGAVNTLDLIAIRRLLAQRGIIRN